MTPDEGRAWFVDAWAVLDGRMFASLRPPMALEGEANADSTLFLSVPDLEPLPIGRISTALRATRSGFQEGFHDTEGNEIPFESVDDLRELTRRAYLTGGLGPDGLAGPRVPGDPGPGPTRGGEFFDQVVHDIGGAELWTPTGVPEHFELGRDARRTVGAAVGAFVVATVIDSNVDESDAPTRQPDVDRLIFLAHVRRSGLLQLANEHRDAGPSALGREVDGVNDVLRLLDSNPVINTRELLDTRSMSVASLCSSQPLARRSEWDPRLTRLSEKLLLPLIQPGYWSLNNQLADLAPVIMMAHLSQGRPYVSGLDASIVETSRDWLRRETPQRLLPSEAEQALQGLVDRRLDGGLDLVQPDPPDSDGGGSSGGPETTADRVGVEYQGIELNRG